MAPKYKPVVLADEETLTVKDFVDAFKKLSDKMDKNHAENTKALVNFAQAHTNKINDALGTIKEGNQKDTQDFKGYINGTLSKALKEHKDKLSKALKDQSEGLNFIRDKVRNIPHVDEEKLTSNILSKVPPVIETTAEEHRDKLEALQGDERLDASAIKGLPKVIDQVAKTPGWGAHPLTIQDSTTVKTKVARNIKFTGATVTQSPDGVTTVAITSGGLNPQTPSGTVNGSNVTFTITGSINALFINGQFMNPGGIDYTLTGTTITMVTAPPTGSTIYAI